MFSGLDLKATTFARVARVAGTAEEQGAGVQSGGEFATLRAKVLVFVNHTMMCEWRPMTLLRVMNCLQERTKQ